MTSNKVTRNIGYSGYKSFCLRYSFMHMHMFIAHKY